MQKVPEDMAVKYAQQPRNTNTDGKIKIANTTDTLMPNHYFIYHLC